MKTTKIIAIAAACIAFASCAKEQENSESSFKAGQAVTLSVSADASATKVTSELNADGETVDFKWEKGDVIKVTVGDKSAEFTLASGEGTKSATFTGEMPADGTTFDVQYPAEDPAITTQAYSSTEAIPHDKMKFAATGIDMDKLDKIELEPQYSALRLNLYGTNQTVSKIVVTNTTSSEDPQPSYTLNISGGKELSTDSSKPTSFFIVVPAGTWNFNAKVYDETRFCSFSTTNANSFPAGKILNMPAKAVKKITLSGAFSVEPGRKVYFSSGNLYYDGSEFKFEDEQYSYQPTYLSSHVSHFRWAMSSDNLSDDINSAISYDTDQLNGTYQDVFFTNEGLYDNGGDHTFRSDFEVEGETGKWRTLSQDEFQYLLGIGSSDVKRTEDYRFAFVKVNDICGLLIFPDIFTWPLDNSLIPGTINDPEPETWDNVTNYSITEFTLLENAGCVFLPAAGYRSGQTMNNVGTEGDYWSSVHASSTSKSGIFTFKIGSANATGGAVSTQGRAVRLVTAAE